MESKPNYQRRLLVILGAAILVGLGAILFGLKSPEQPQIQTTNIPETENQISQSEDSGIIAQEVKVSRVVDGDTIEIEGGEKVRYIGIDTPETVDPRRAVGCFGQEASSQNKKLVEGKKVILEKDITDRDKYSRLLRYVYIKQENDELLFVNDYLVKEGYAKVVTYPPDVKFTEQFLQSQEEARVNNRGLWQKCL